MRLKNIFMVLIVGLFFAACSNKNTYFEEQLMQQNCPEELFTEAMQKVDEKSDAVYVGLNAGLIARNCNRFELSTKFFDKVEDSYQVDIDLRKGTTKVAKTVTSVIANDTFMDYDGTLYERIMVNAYKGLNFMSEGDFKNARVEFKRALLRQDRAKHYFKSQIDKNKKDLQEARKQDKNFAKNYQSSQSKINASYENLFNEFETSKNFTNPYATYLASIYYYMNRDFTLARNLFREIKILNPKNAEIEKEHKIMQQGSKNKRLVFVVYENGFGAIKDQFKLTIPFIFSDQIVTSSVALPTLKRRSASYEYLNVNGKKTAFLVSLDNVVASEFKHNLPSEITKAITSTIIKTAINLAVANNTGNAYAVLTTNLFTASMTQVDTRNWRGLPQSVSVVAVENKGKIEIKDPNNRDVWSGKIDKNKNALIIVRSFAPHIIPNVKIIQK